MRWMVRLLFGIVGLAAVAGGVLWVVLPALAAPAGVPPDVPPPDDAALAAGLRSAPGGQDSLQLSASEVEGLAEAWARVAGLTELWVTLGQESADLQLGVAVPPSVPRLGGHTVGVEAVVRPTVAADGTVTMTVQHIQVGRIAIDRFVPVATLLRWAAAHAGPPHPWWHLDGAAVVIDSRAAPPVNLGEFALRVTPSALDVNPSGLLVTGTAQALVRLDAASLSSALAGPLQAESAPVAATVQLQQGRAILWLFAPTGARTAIALTPTVPQPGVLRLGAAGPGNAADTVAQLLGGAPSWLSADAGGLTIDFRQMPPIEVAQGVRLRLLPQSVQVDPALLQGWVSVEPA